MRGAWTVDVRLRPNIYGKAFSYATICTKYGASTYNPVTGSTGATPDCTDVTDYKIHTEALAPGDPFHLASGKVPFFLKGRGPVPTLDQLYAEANASQR